MSFALISKIVLQILWLFYWTPKTARAKRCMPISKFYNFKFSTQKCQKTCILWRKDFFCIIFVLFTQILKANVQICMYFLKISNFSKVVCVNFKFLSMFFRKNNTWNYDVVHTCVLLYLNFVTKNFAFKQAKITSLLNLFSLQNLSGTYFNLWCVVCVNFQIFLFNFQCDQTWCLVRRHLQKL